MTADDGHCRGRSSAGRAPALQAGGRRFEPDRLHQLGRGWLVGATAEKTRVSESCRGSDRRWAWWDRRWRCRECVPGFGGACLFFVRVNQVLVRLWALPGRDV